MKLEYQVATSLHKPVIELSYQKYESMLLFTAKKSCVTLEPKTPKGLDH